MGTLSLPKGGHPGLKSQGEAVGNPADDVLAGWGLGPAEIVSAKDLLADFRNHH
jgi:hypothetical protein